MSSGYVCHDVSERRRMVNDKVEKCIGTSDELYDHRPLFEKVEEENQGGNEQKCCKDNIEMECLNQEQIDTEEFKDWEGKRELIDYRNKMERLEKDGLDQKKSSSENGNNSSHVRKSVKRKSDLSNTTTDVSVDINVVEEGTTVNECCRRKRKRCELDCDNFKYKGSGLTCIGILPGLGSNIDSSDDSDQSCSSGSEGNDKTKYDLLGRRLEYVSTKSSNENR